MEELIGQLISGLKGVWKYRWYAIGVAWLVAAAGWTKVALLPDDYQTSARVYVDTQSILKPLMSGMTAVPNLEQQVGIMSRTLLSRPNLERVMRMVDLDIANATPGEQQRAMEELQRKIKVTGGNNDIYTIVYNNRSPRVVRDVVQSLLTIFLEGSVKGKSGDSRKAVQFIDEQIKQYEDKLTSAENSVKEFKLKNNGLLPRQGTDYNGQLMQSSDALDAARLELAEAEQARKAIAAQVTGDEPILGADAMPPSIDNPELDARIAALNKALDALRMQYTELHPDIIATKRLIAQLEERKREESKLKQNSDPGKNYSPMLQQLKVAQTEAEARVAAISARVQEYQLRHQRLLAQANAVPEVESALAQLTRDYQVNKDNYEKLIGRREAAKMSGDLSTTTELMSFKIIEPPAVPAAPNGPNRVLLYSVTLGGALLIGVAAALLISQIRPTFLSPEELHQRTGLPVLGTVAMNWTDVEQQRQRRGKYWFSATAASLVLAYGGVLLATMLR